jgi:hypothetical protein
MTTNALTIYETWDLQAPPIPPRSRLYSLEPVGVGTARVESLASYIARLAEAHNVSTGKLVRHEILCHFGRSYLPGNMTPFWSRQARAINGTNTWARDMVQVIEWLTMRQDLHFLTLQPWSEVLSSRGLLRHNRAWCPACFEERRQAGQIAYEPLIWILNVVTMCPSHRQRLCLCCPHCHKSLPWLEAYMRPGYCSRCRGWLGVPSEEEAAGHHGLNRDELKWQSWVADAVGELLAAAPGLPHLPGKDRVASGIAMYVERVAAGGLNEFARKLQACNLDIDPSSLCDWRSGKLLLRLSRLLQLCYCLGTSPFRFLTDETDAVYFTELHTLEFSESPRPARRPPNPLDIDQLRKALERVLASDEEPPPSLNQVAKRLGYYEHTQLSRRLPEQSRAISERYRAYRKKKSIQRRERIRDEVRQAAFEIADRGEYPTMSRVSALLGKTSSIRFPETMTAWHEALRELGLKQ